MLTLVPPQVNQNEDGLRPVNINTDLAPLADLIEMSFRHTMDENGRAAIREMRYMSKMGAGLRILGRLNELAVGISLGFVWIQDGRLVGNVSLYPAGWHKGVGDAWIIANVAVHPDYQRRGIARRLMDASLETIASKGGQYAILQVEYDNYGALQLYENLNFRRERAFTTWWRSAMATAPAYFDRDDVHIVHPRRSDFKAEYALASRRRPNERGGIGWLKPLHQQVFKPTLWQRISNFISINNTERLIVRSDDGRSVLAELMIEAGFAMSRTRLTLIADSATHDPCAEALLNTALRRFRTRSFVIEHPHDDQQTADLLRDYRFFPHRSVWHMRCTV